MGGAQRCRHGPDFDLERVSDRAIVQVGPVAQEDDRALSFRKATYPELNGWKIGTAVLLLGLRNDGVAVFIGGAASAGARGVHDYPPDPGLERAIAAKTLNLLDRPRERLLHRLPAQIHAPGQRDRHASERTEPLPVERLQLGNLSRCLSSAHYLYD